MGYTHYWSTKKRPTKKQWDAIKREVGKLFATKEAFKTIRYEGNRNTAPILNDEFIRFNGRGENAHETFLFTRDITKFEFCKTARKPYDKFVCGVLIVACHFAPDCFDISSDGCRDDLEWVEALEFLKSVSFEHYEIPATIEKNEKRTMLA